MTIESLPGSKLSPETLLAQALEEVESMDSVVIIAHRKSGYTTVAYSTMKKRDVAFALLRLQAVALDEARGDVESMPCLA